MRVCRECIFTGPVYKRGPPRGYIAALEQMSYRTESILAAILRSPHPAAGTLVALMEQDDFARETLLNIANSPMGTSPGSATILNSPVSDPSPQDNAGQSQIELPRQMNLPRERQARPLRESITFTTQGVDDGQSHEYSARCPA
ncbi:hypothetical protein NEOLEDRAFT_479136 [Neolentinus lepideus HHB14362 ss-1]|uniref:Uncharacterized protein n=1 Tax=Neolentinus lepideus HHB14362 ss-1 TaxID=1314782 RepID=A0A165VL14_9AGAM|nr:hypothetical protein NEOLEDRAFT_479136 [Neolentinus lepideus HHB14362 ss-1]